MRIVLTLRQGRNQSRRKISSINSRPIESTFGIIMLAVVDNKPEVLNLRDMLWHFLEFRRQMVVRRTQFELREAESGRTILGGTQASS